MSQPPPLQGVRVLEFAGLAPGPFAGMLCADYGATVLRIDRAHPQAHTASPPPATSDQLTRHKSSIAVNIKTAGGIALIKKLLPFFDVVIDPFRPGVLEKMGLGPEEVMLRLNPRIIVARMTGFRRDGKYKNMAGHDINYIAVSGALSIFGRKDEKPYPPANILGDFAGGGAVCFTGILLALMQRERTGKGQVIEANMVDGSAYLTTMPRLLSKSPMWNAPRGTNMLDGGSPYYDTYKTKDSRYMAVGALEPQFYAELLRGLELNIDDFGGEVGRHDKRSWPRQAEAFTKKFLSKTRDEWERIFDGTDACCTPVLSHEELEKAGYNQRPFVTLKSSPGLALHESHASDRPTVDGQGPGVPGSGWVERGLSPGVGGENILADIGLERGRDYDLIEGGLGLRDEGRNFKL